MENYIVRIYRRESIGPENITGIVEKPDSGENISFHNNEEFINIFIPPDISTRPANRRQFVEQRRYRRFNVNNSTLLFDTTTDVGEILDISLGGLFFCSNMPDILTGSFKVGILCEGIENFCTGKINCKKMLLRHSVHDNHKSKKRFIVEFDDLKPVQKLQLEHIIKNYAVCEV